MSATEKLEEGQVPEEDTQEQKLREQVAAILEDGSLSRADKIRALHELGYSQREICAQFPFAESTVYQVLPAKRPQGKRGNGGDVEGDQLPMVRKYGQGVEVMNPEVVMARILNDGQIPPAYGQGLKDGMLLLRVAQLMVMDLVNIRKGEAEAQAKAMEPLLKVMREGREEMDAAAQRAKGSNLDVAREAAQESLGRAMPYIDERLESLEESMKRSEPNPMMGLMARTMEGVMKQLMGSFGMGGQGQQRDGETQMPGVTWNRREAK